MDGDERRAKHPWCVDGVFKNLKVVLPTAPGSGKSVVFTLRKNGSNTGLTVTISNLATTATDSTNTVSVAPGDMLSLSMVGSGTPTTSAPNVILEFHGTNAGESGHGASGHTANSVVFNGNFGSALGSGAKWDGDASVVAVAGAITGIAAHVEDGSAGVGNQYEFSIIKNGVVQDGTGGTTDTRCIIAHPAQANNNTFSLAVTPGDLVSVRFGSPTFKQGPMWGIRFHATTDHESNFCGSSLDSVPASPAADHFAPCQGHEQNTSTTEADRRIAVGVSDFGLNKLYTVTGNVANHQVSLRKNGANTAVSLTHTNTAHSNTSAGQEVFTGSDVASINIAGLGSGFGRPYQWGLRQVTGSGLVTAITSDTDSDFPAMTASMYGGQAVSSDIAANLPAMTAALTGTESNDGVSDAELPAMTAAMVGGPATQAVIGASLPALTGELLGGAPIEAVIDAAPFALVGEMYGGQEVTSDIAVDLPKLTSLVLGGAAIFAVIDATFPAATGLLTSGELSGEIAGALPAMTGSIVGYSGGGVTAVIAATLPRARYRGIGSFPVERLTLTVNGVDYDTWWQRGWDVSKNGNQERMNFAIADPRYHEDAVTVETNDVILLRHPTGGLIFGGLAAEVERTRNQGEAGTLTQIVARDWMFLAEQVFVPKRKYTSQDALALFDFLLQKYLSAKGMVNIGPTTGGPILPDLVVDNYTTKLRDLWDRMRDECQWPPRVNGELEAALVEPGSLVWPGGEINGYNAKLKPQLTKKKEILTEGGANRLWMEIEEPPSGDKARWFFEDHIANGVATVFPLNVMPTETEGSTRAKVEAGAVTLQLKDLPVGGVLRWGNRFYLGNDPREYMVTSGGTVDAEGNVDIGCETIELETGDGEQIRFLPPAFMKLFLNGTETEFAGAPWVYEGDEVAFVNPSGAPPIGTVVRAGQFLSGGTTVRAWESGPVVPQLDIGWFDHSILVNGVVENESYYDPVYAVQHLRERLAEPIKGKDVVTFMTHEHGIYPFIKFPMNFPESLVVGDYYAETVKIAATGADPRLTTNDLAYLVTARKDTIGRAPWDFYRRVTKVKWGRGEVSTPTNFQWTANREYNQPDGASGLVFNPVGGWTWTAWQDVVSVTDAALVLTSVIVELSDAAQPYAAWARGFEVQLAVSDAGEAPADEDIIAKLKGYSKDASVGVLNGTMRFPVAVDACPSGKRLSIRMRCSTGGWLSIPGPWELAVQYLKKPLTGNLHTSPYLHEHTSAGELYEALTPAPTANDWSDWVELIATTPYDLYLTAYVFAPYALDSWEGSQIQFGIAAPGDEPTDEGVIADIADSTRATALGIHNYFEFENPLFVNSSQRVMVRMKANATSGAGIGFALHYVRAEE